MSGLSDGLRPASEPLNGLAFEEPGGSLRRAGSVLLWYVVPALALAAVVAYVLGATVGHANPPVVPVEGLSMRPTMQAGDLIVLSGVDPKTLRKGDIVAVNVPKTARDQYGLSGQIVHRIKRIGHDSAGLFFITKGDANEGADVFQTRPGDIVGKLRLDIPAAGYPFIFFRSRQGEIFLAVGALVGLLYFLLGLFEERRAYVEGSVLTMQTVLEETQELKQAIAGAEQLAARPALDRLADEVRASSHRSAENEGTLRELVAAIADYGQHLRSHTEVMKNLATTTGELATATAQMRSAVEEGRAAMTLVPRPEPEPVVQARPEAPTTLELDRLLAEAAATIEATTRRRDELRRRLGEERPHPEALRGR